MGNDGDGAAATPHLRCDNGHRVERLSTEAAKGARGHAKLEH